ncbi:MAG: hypothetical protein OHK0039_16980 [Bacteroidia bacterium]
METQIDSISYALGHDLGRNLASQEVSLNPEAFLEGIRTTTTGEEPLFSEETSREIIMSLQEEITNRQRAAAAEQQAQAQVNAPVQIGKIAPEIALPAPDGNIMKLSDLRGKVVLIDFWASWCKPCRVENPNVVRVYNQYKPKGFEILGVSLDRDRAAWLQAIEKDGLTWPHVSDLKFWQSEAAQRYQVSAIPYTVLIDAEGSVIAENLRGASLEAKLAEIFN